MYETSESGIRQALEGVRDAMDLLFDALRDPYETLAHSDPDAVLGAPLPTPTYRSPVDLKAWTAEVEGNGRSAWALHQVEEREGQIRGLLHDYARGLYSSMTVGEWMATLSKFREASIADVLTAMQAPRGWDQIDLSRRNNNSHALDKEILSPRDVAPQLGLDERTVRRRIADGRLGPWKKEGGRWQISRTSFLRYWDQLAADSDQPRPPGVGEASGGGEGLDHLHL